MFVVMVVLFSSKQKPKMLTMNRSQMLTMLIVASVLLSVVQSQFDNDPKRTLCSPAFDEAYRMLAGKKNTKQ